MAKMLCLSFFKLTENCQFKIIRRVQFYKRLEFPAQIVVHFYQHHLISITQLYKFSIYWSYY